MKSASGDQHGQFTVDFRAGGNLTEFRHSGFSVAESGGRWAVGTASSVVMPRPDVQRPEPTLLVSFLPCTIEGYVSEQRLIIEINGTVVYDKLVHGWTTIEVPVSATLIAAEPELSIVFRHPGAVAPVTTGANADARPLAIFFAKLLLLGVRRATVTTTATAAHAVTRRAVPPEQRPASASSSSSPTTQFSQRVSQRTSRVPPHVYRFPRWSNTPSPLTCVSGSSTAV